MADNRHQKGQILLIVVLVMVVGLTIGLSVASRNITSVRTSVDEVNSQQALAAAEAGIEKIIGSGDDTALGAFGASKYETNSSPVQGERFTFNAGVPVLKDDGIDLWFSQYTPDLSYDNPWSGGFTVYWGEEEADCDNAAIEIDIISGSTSAPVIKRHVYDPCATRRGENKFSAPQSALADPEISGKRFKYKTPVINVSNGLIGRVIPIYTDSSMGVITTSGSPLPQQGTLLESIGTSGDTQRKVSVFRGFPKIPSELFSYSIFSPK